MIATGGEFTGRIIATGGSIGGVDIADIDLGYEVRIECNGSSVFTDENSSDKILRAILYRGKTEVTNSVVY
jgi:hypothetical protein